MTYFFSFSFLFLEIEIGGAERPPVRPMWSNAIREESEIALWFYFILVFAWNQLQTKHQSPTTDRNGTQILIIIINIYIITVN